LFKIGIFANFFAIVAGGLIGTFIGHKFNKDLNELIMNCVGLFIIILGIKSTIGAGNDIRVLVFLIIGSIIGFIIDIDKNIKKFSQFLERKFVKNRESTFGKGLVISTILYCVGAMSIIGSIKSGLSNDNDILYIKSIIDGVSAIVFASVYGIGVMFSGFAVFIYEGIFYIFASELKGILTESAAKEIDFLGGIMILGIGVNILFKKEIKIANMLPAIFIPMIFPLICTLFSKIFNF
jgi:uncharacterized membrane protein YqgA involved in biofilm formation